MATEDTNGKTPRWDAMIEKFERLVVGALALLLVTIVAVLLVVVIGLFVGKVMATMSSVETVGDLQEVALKAFSGILLVLLGLELLDTVKVYFTKHSVRVEVILLVGLIAMGRHVLEIDLHSVEPLKLLAFSTLIVALSGSYFLVKRAPRAAPRPGE